MTTPDAVAAAPERTVLVLLHGDRVGGASLAMARLAPLLEERGWRPVFWASRPGELFDELERRGLRPAGAFRPLEGYSIKALALPPGPLRRLAAIPGYLLALAGAIRREQPDVIHANSMYMVLEALVARVLRRPVVFHVHDFLRDNRKGRLVPHVLHALGATVIGVSDGAVGQLSTGRRRAVPVYESPGPLPPGPAAGPADGDAVRVTTIGVIAPRKGTDVFADAVAIVRDTAGSPPITFRVVGAADEPLAAAWADAQLARFAALGIEHAPRADVPSVLRATDVFVLPSREDPFPMAMLEAMGHGVAVIGTQVGGIAEQVTEGTGLLVPSGDAKALADAVLELAADPARRAALGGAARRRVETEFSVERQADRLDAIYRDVLDRRRASR